MSTRGLAILLQQQFMDYIACRSRLYPDKNYVSRQIKHSTHHSTIRPCNSSLRRNTATKNACYRDDGSRLSLGGLESCVYDQQRKVN